MRSYGQYCPIARAASVLAERWNPIILRNLLNGDTTFTQLVNDAPGIPRSLLRSRLRELERAGLVHITPALSGRGHTYKPTPAAQDLRDVLKAMGAWADRWLEVTDADADPGYTLHTWCERYLAIDQLPDHRVVARFDFPTRPTNTRHFWFVVDGATSEICRTNPGYDEDLVVTAEATALAEWHLGHLTWEQAIRTGRIHVTGPRALTRALPTWNQRSVWAHMPTHT